MIVKGFYTLLGMIAWANERLSHQGMSFIPGNWIIAIGLAALPAISGPEVWNALLTGMDTTMGSPWIWVFVDAVFVIILLLAGVTFFNGYIVFQRTDKNALASQPSQAVMKMPWKAGEKTEIGELNVTGRFILDKDAAQRFLNVPAKMEILETGEIAFFSRLDASISMYERLILRERVGIWYLMMKRAGLHSVEPGLLYMGRASHPALRVRHTDAITSLPATTFLSFSNEAERRSIVDLLNQLSPL